LAGADAPVFIPGTAAAEKRSAESFGQVLAAAGIPDWGVK